MKIKGIEQRRLNKEKSLSMASSLFPDEEWVNTEPNVFVVKSRMVLKYREWYKWEREMSQVRILTSQGSVAYFLPEKKHEGKGKVYVDTVIDGEIVELKTVAGNRNTLGTAFKQGFKQGAATVQEHPEIQKNSVFIRLVSDFTVESVKEKLRGN